MTPAAYCRGCAAGEDGDDRVSAGRVAPKFALNAEPGAVRSGRSRVRSLVAGRTQPQHVQRAAVGDVVSVKAVPVAPLGSSSAELTGTGAYQDASSDSGLDHGLGAFLGRVLARHDVEARSGC